MRSNPGGSWAAGTDINKTRENLNSTRSFPRIWTRLKYQQKRHFENFHLFEHSTHGIGYRDIWSRCTARGDIEAVAISLSLEEQLFPTSLEQLLQVGHCATTLEGIKFCQHARRVRERLEKFSAVSVTSTADNDKYQTKSPYASFKMCPQQMRSAHASPKMGLLKICSSFSPHCK